MLSDWKPHGILIAPVACDRKPRTAESAKWARGDFEQSCVRRVATLRRAQKWAPGRRLSEFLRSLTHLKKTICKPTDEVRTIFALDYILWRKRLAEKPIQPRFTPEPVECCVVS